MSDAIAKPYLLKDCFLSVQGEGTKAGTLAFFVRLGGCNRKCSFCDTDFEGGVPMTAQEILEALQKIGEEAFTACRTVIITGGEPLTYDLKPLATLLKENGYVLHLETNGDLLRRYDRETLHLFSWITASPKTVFPTGEFHSLAHELKYVVPDQASKIDWNFSGTISLQPEWSNKDAVTFCLGMMRLHPGARLSVQTHKFIGLE